MRYSKIYWNHASCKKKKVTYVVWSGTPFGSLISNIRGNASQNEISLVYKLAKNRTLKKNHLTIFPKT